MKKLVSILCCTAFALCLMCAQPLAAQNCSGKHGCAVKDSLKQEIEKGIAQIMQDLKVIGLGVAVVTDGDIIYSNSWGYKNLENKTPLKEDDIFRIASISKSFTATSILQLVEQGKINLNDDISNLVGFTVRNPNYPDVVITPYMLLSHTSSLNDSQGYFSLKSIDPSKNPNFAKAYNNYRPGSKYEYCNLNYNMMGTILERISQVRFDRYVYKNILEPLGVYGGYWVDALDKSKFVTLYQPNKEGVMTAQPEAYAPRREEIANYEFGYSTPIFSPTGGMKTSPRGLARVMSMHMGLGTTKDGVKILKPESSLLMQSRLTATQEYKGDENFYGFAIETTPTLIPGKIMIGHTGGAYGVYTSMFWNKERTFGIVIMTNGCAYERESGFMSIHYRVANCLYNNLIKGTPADRE